MIKYSIILPVRNSLDYAKDCIQTILSQAYDNYEIIVSDNHSAESVAEYVQSLNSPLLRLIKPEHPLGMVDHFEFALSFARGEWIIFLGADDGLQSYFFDLCNVLTEQAKRMGLKIINGSRAYFFWDGCEKIYGDLKIYYVARPFFYKKNAKKNLLNALVGVNAYFDLPQMYTTSLVHRSVVERVKKQQGGRFYSSLTPDANGAANICSVESHYMESLIPLGWVGTSPRSNGFQYSSVGSEGGAILKSNLLSRHICWHPQMGFLQASGAVKILPTPSFYLYESLLQAHRLLSPRWKALYSSRVFKLVFFARLQEKMRSNDLFNDEQKAVFFDILKSNGLSLVALKVIGMPLAKMCSLGFKLDDYFYRFIQYGFPAMRYSLHTSKCGCRLMDANRSISNKIAKGNFIALCGSMSEGVWGRYGFATAFFRALYFVWQKIVEKFFFIGK